MVGAVIVGAVRDRDRELIGLGVRTNSVIRSGLRRVIGRAGAIRTLFVEGLIGVEVEVAVDLTGRDVVETSNATLASCLEHRLGAHDVGGEKASRVENGQRVVGLSSKVHDGVDLVLANGGQPGIEVTNVSLNEGDLVEDRAQ